VLRLTDAAVDWPRIIHRWAEVLQKTGRNFEILLVDDGTRESLASEARAWAQSLPHLRYFRHDSPSGFGACLRTAVAEARFPLIAYAGLAYPYTPSDLLAMLERIEQIDPLMQRSLDLISGCRTGRARPRFWCLIDRFYRGFCRIALGLPLEPVPTWLGFREHLGAWLAWLIYAVPLHDPFSEFKLVRKSVLERFPIQCDGDFAHVEIVAKATFLTCMIDEVLLTPNSTAIPPASWAGCWKLFRHALFYYSPTACQQDQISQQGEADKVPAILSGGVDGARQVAVEPPTSTVPDPSGSDVDC